MKLTSEKKAVSVIGILFYIVTYITLAILTQADPWPVFLGTLPIFFYVVIAVAVTLQNIDHKMILLLLAFLLPALFFLLWLSESISDLSRMDGQVLVAIQTILLLLLTGILLLVEKSYQTKEKQKFKQKQQESIDTKKELEKYVRQLDLLRDELERSQKYKEQAEKFDEQMAEYTTKIYELEQEISSQNEIKDKIEHYKQRINGYAEALGKLEEKIQEKNKYETLAKKYQNKNEEYNKRIHDLQDKLTRTQEELKVTKTNVTSTLRGVEDKCKAINFVVGRVYADKRGGSKEVRQKLHIPSELYNSFSKMRSEYDPAQIPELIQLVKSIYSHLLQLELPEHNLIKTRKEYLPVLRDPEGKSKIIDVLENNDNDPVREYFLEAKEICNRLIVYFENEEKK